MEQFSLSTLVESRIPNPYDRPSVRSLVRLVCLAPPDTAELLLRTMLLMQESGRLTIGSLSMGTYLAGDFWISATVAPHDGAIEHSTHPSPPARSAHDSRTETILPSPTFGLSSVSTGLEPSYPDPYNSPYRYPYSANVSFTTNQHFGQESLFEQHTTLSLPPHRFTEPQTVDPSLLLVPPPPASKNVTPNNHQWPSPAEPINHPSSHTTNITQLAILLASIPHAVAKAEHFLALMAHKLRVGPEPSTQRRATGEVALPDLVADGSVTVSMLANVQAQMGTVLRGIEAGLELRRQRRTHVQLGSEPWCVPGAEREMGQSCEQSAVGIQEGSAIVGFGDAPMTAAKAATAWMTNAKTANAKTTKKRKPEETKWRRAKKVKEI